MTRREWEALSEQEKWNYFRECNQEQRKETLSWIIDFYRIPIEDYVRAVQAKLFHANRVDFQDLMHEVWVGFFRQVKRFNPNIGASFLQWSFNPGKSWVYGCIIDYLRRNQFTSRSSSRILRSETPARDALQHLLRKPRLTKEDLLDAGITDVVIPQFLSQNARSSGDNAECESDYDILQYAESASIEKDFSEIRSTVLQFLNSIKAPDRYWFYRYWFAGVPQPAIATAAGVSVSSVNNSLDNTLRALKSHLNTTNRWDEWKSWLGEE